MNHQIAEKHVTVTAKTLDGRPQRNTVFTSRADIAIRVSDGEGLPILLVHDLNGSSEDFDALFSYAFAHDHRLLAVDLPGHGRSGEASDHETAYTVEGYAESLLETLERLDIESAFIIDLSPKGMIGRELLSILPGAMGLAYLGGATFCETQNSEPEQTPIYQISSLSEDALEPIIANLELREAALSLAPRLWYGG
jgi:pimeloyl-ACP methyl ester carboxylesterase